MKQLRLALAFALAPPGLVVVSATPAIAKSALSASEIAAIQQACETVSIQYARYLDAKDWQNLPSVFASDGVWEVLSNHLAGHEAIRNYWKQRTAAWAPTHGRLHQIANQVIEVIDRDHARGTSNAIVYFFDTAPDANKSLTPVLIARNTDEFVRTPQGWKLQLRRVERVANVGQ
jgi:3-phenylpropionate/cinnamic acid dioxygenase small subunit